MFDKKDEGSGTLPPKKPAQAAATPPAAPAAPAAPVPAVPAAPAPVAEGGVAVAAKAGMGTGLKVALGVLATVLVVGGGIGAYLFLRTPSHIPPDADALLFHTIEELMLAEDVRFRLSFPGETIAAFAGDSVEDIEDVVGVSPNDYEFAIAIDTVRIDEKRMDAEVALSVLPSTGDEGLELNTRFVDEAIYIQLDKFNFGDLGFDLSSILGVWVDLDIGAVQQQVEGLMGSADDEEESLNAEDYVFPDVKKSMEHIRDIYMLAPPFDLTLAEENVAAGTVTLQLRMNDNTEQFLIDAAVESYVLYLMDVDRAIAEKDSVGEAELVEALKTFKAELIAEHGERGELLAAEMEEDLEIDMAFGPDSPVDDVAMMLMIDVNTGRAKQISFVPTFKDGIERPAIVGTWGGYNSGRLIPVPKNAMSVEKFTELLFGAFMGDAMMMEEEVVETDGDVMMKEKDGDAMVKEGDLFTADSVDSDDDGLMDADELFMYETDPQDADSDGDGLTDYEEVMVWKTDPNMEDTDGDTFLDGAEVENGYNPLE